MDFILNLEKERPIKEIPVEVFEKTDLEKYLDRELGFRPRSVYDDIESTYEKYHSMYGHDYRIRIIASEITPMILRRGPHRIEVNDYFEYLKEKLEIEYLHLNFLSKYNLVNKTLWEQSI